MEKKLVNVMAGDKVVDFKRGKVYVYTYDAFVQELFNRDEHYAINPTHIPATFETITVINPTEDLNKGIKHDQQKPPMDLLPYESLEEIAKVLAAGEKKYGTANWANGIEMRRLIAAAMRHIGQFNNGEDKDSETETLHLANAACNLLFAIWMYKNRPDLDNRWVKGIKKKE